MVDRREHLQEGDSRGKGMLQDATGLTSPALQENLKAEDARVKRQLVLQCRGTKGYNICTGT